MFNPSKRYISNLLTSMALGFLVILSQCFLMADKEELLGKPCILQETAKIINHTKYSLWLQTGSKTAPNKWFDFNYPFGAQWIKPGAMLEAKDAPLQGTAKLYYTDKENPGIFTQASFVEIDFLQRDGIFSNDDIVVRIKFTLFFPPIQAGISSPNLSPFYHYTITVSEKQSSDKKINTQE